MSDSKAQWLHLSERGLAYHRDQYDVLYRSTDHFCRWLSDQKLMSPDDRIQVADIGAGMGANLFHLARRFPGCRFTGIELNEDLVRAGREELAARGTSTVSLEQGDLFALDPRHRGAYDGIVSLQTLSWLPEFQAPLASVLSLRPRWIALSSLFYDGPLTCRIEVSDHTTPDKNGEPTRSLYCVFPLPQLREFLTAQGYSRVRADPFVIDIDLPPPSHGSIGTYTRRLESGERLQFSGPMPMPWYFVAAWRDEPG